MTLCDAMICSIHFNTKIIHKIRILLFHLAHSTATNGMKILSSYTKNSKTNTHARTNMCTISKYAELNRSINLPLGIIITINEEIKCDVTTINHYDGLNAITSYNKFYKMHKNILLNSWKYWNALTNRVYSIVFVF